MKFLISLLLILASLSLSAQVKVDMLLNCTANGKPTLSVYRKGNEMKMLIPSPKPPDDIVILIGSLREASFDFDIYSTTSDGDKIFPSVGKFSGYLSGLDFHAELKAPQGAIKYICRRVGR